MAFIVLAVLLVSAIAAPLIFDEQMQKHYIDEGAAVQVLSAAGYVAVVLILARETGLRGVRSAPYLFVLPVAMCARELDFHSAFTSLSITKMSFYLSGDVPVMEKVIAVAFVAIILASVLALFNHSAAFVSAVAKGRIYAVALVFSGGLVILSEMMDGLHRRLSRFGVDLPDIGKGTLEAVEEALELGIPAFMVLAVFAAFPRYCRAPS